MATSYDLPEPRTPQASPEDLTVETFLTEYARLTADTGDCTPDEEQDWFVLSESATHFFGKLLQPYACHDCGQPAEAVDLNAYGQGKPEVYCRVCYIRDAFCSDDRISTSFNSEPYDIVAVPEKGSNPRANLDLLTIYVPIKTRLQARIAEYTAVVESGGEWAAPIVGQLTAELNEIAQRIEALYAAGFDSDKS